MPDATFAARVMAAPDKSDFAPNAAPGYAPPSPARYLAAPTTVNLSSDPLRGGSVLLVEDNEVTAMLTRDLLIKLGYEVVTAKNGKAAVDICEVRRFDLILMDCQMPVMDGYEATLRLRAQEARRPDLTPTPIVAVTANTLAGDRERCLESGMNDYLAKPYSVRELRSVLQKWHVDQEIAQAPRVHNVVPIKG